VFAAFVEHTDHEIGRMLEAFDEPSARLDNTLVFYIAGDNGTSGRRRPERHVQRDTPISTACMRRSRTCSNSIDKWGGPRPIRTWRRAGRWPRRALRLDEAGASDFGGTRNGMVVHWPKGIKAKGEIRTQFSHVIDVAPTILEAIGLPEPKVVNGTPQIPMEGTSLVYTFDDAKARERHTTQYFEIAGNRAIYHDGWLRAPSTRRHGKPSRDASCWTRTWELYDVRADFSLANDLAAKNPAKLKEMQALFLKEAKKYHVLPIDDRVFERLNAKTVGRPDLMAGRTSLTWPRA
jgi:arylsulfatase A-like enzyme